MADSSPSGSPRRPRLFTDEARLHLVLLLGLTLTTGMVDAIGYLGLDKVFTANMTGNVVILGIGLAGGRESSSGTELPILGPTVALLAFIVGAITAGRINRHTAPGWTRTTTAMFLTTGIGIAMEGTAAIAVNPLPGTAWAFIVTGVLALLMGVQAATARRLGVADVTTVVVTSTLTGLAADSRLAGGDGKRWPRRVIAVAAILVGAALGAVLLSAGLGPALLTCGLTVLAMVLIGHVLVTKARHDR